MTDKKMEHPTIAKKLITLCFFILFGSVSIWAMSKPEARSKLNEAEQLYINEDFAEALSLYEEVLNDGYESAPLLHNLGLVYFKNNQLVDAIVTLERAKRLKPFDKAINHDLKLIKENVNTEIISAPPFFMKKWYTAMISILGTRAWLVLHILFLGLFLVGLYFYLIREFPLPLHNTYIEGILVSVLVLCIILALFAYSRTKMIERSDVGIINQNEVVLRAGAEDNTEVIMDLNEGVKAYVEDQIGTFLKVRLEDYSVGWIKESEIERI